jgi:hypothetical protein
MENFHTISTGSTKKVHRKYKDDIAKSLIIYGSEIDF